jgi:rfaE bifunctional protein nucleotidyltransferase chain/domain
MHSVSNELTELLKNSKSKRIVFTNGCFDILHSGHISYLNEAKLLGDILIVGLNSDKSVQRLKGPSRPINNEQDRKFFLENLRSVDGVEIFDTETPLELIKMIMPNTLVKGGDWEAKDIIGSDIIIKNGGEVKSLQFKDGHSTTSFIEMVQGKK